MKCPESGTSVQGIFHYGTELSCSGCGRLLRLRRYSSLRHTAQFPVHTIPAAKTSL
jgi:hypothetical protein